MNVDNGTMYLATEKSFSPKVVKKILPCYFVRLAVLGCRINRCVMGV